MCVVGPPLPGCLSMHIVWRALFYNNYYVSGEQLALDVCQYRVPGDRV